MLSAINLWTKYNRLLSKFFPFAKSPVLLMSYPRSGSSWVGEMLGHSESIAYLREPINQPCLKKLKQGTLYDPRKNEETLSVYRYYADLAFEGVPPGKKFEIIREAKQFSIFGRQRRRVLIKEVNPLAMKFLVVSYSPKVIILLRHPAAVADSFLRMGWLRKGLDEFGQAYGKNLHRAISCCDKEDIYIAKYETIAIDPNKGFKDLFRFIEVQVPKSFEALLKDYCYEGDDNENPYSIKRNSSHEVNKWRNNLSEEQISLLRYGYERSGLNYYQENEDW